MGKEEKKNTKELVLYCLTSKVSFGVGTVLNHCRMHVYPLIRHGCGGQLGGLDRYSAASLVVLLGQQRSEHGCNAVPIDLSMTTYSDACRPAPPSCWVKSARCNNQPVSMWDRALYPTFHFTFLEYRIFQIIWRNAFAHGWS
jgi:hypothetical protein